MRSSKNSDDDIVLVGMMGTGKTTVGRLVSCRLSRPFIDSDEQVELQTGRTVREIFETDGEPAFRKWESAVLRQALVAPAGPRVITAAGGVVLDADNRRRLCTVSNVVWLRAAPEVLAARVGRALHRPLLEGNALSTLQRLAREREALYDEVATFVVDTDRASTDDVVTTIVEWLAS